MSDYLTTLNSALKKAKEVKDSDSFKDIVNQGKAIAGDVSAYAKLKVSIAHDEEELRRTYIEIGKLFYDENKNAPYGFYEPLFGKVTQLTDDIKVESLEADTLRTSILSSTKKQVSDDISQEAAGTDSLEVIEFGKRSR